MTYNIFSFKWIRQQFPKFDILIKHYKDLNVTLNMKLKINRFKT